MATAVITGASSGIGKAVSLRLLEFGYDVIGISRNIDKNAIDHPNFSMLCCDLSDEIELNAIIPLLQTDPSISILCNIAGFGVFKPYEEIDTNTISKMVALNLNAPMILSNVLLKVLKFNQGIIFNITSIEALRSSKFSAIYTATKTGLRAFSQSLFEEVRKSGVNVVSINPDMTDTSFFDELRFNPSAEFDKRLEAEDIADVIQNILEMRNGACITDITIRPQKFAIVKKS
ncbi:SDR family NAD(P)-dependent oxidoreductase [Sulfurimonas sp. HSL-1716]|uniref:SDR family oxidoreductase n=1 Tax=Hydrocurvibacter sulfurireducens TaxID=3131937 RepID=UPI0031F8916F